MPEIKQYRATCQGCGEQTFKPYVDFEASKKARSKKNVNKNCVDGIIISLTTIGCPIAGCCCATDKMKEMVKSGAPIKDLEKTYMEAYKCKECGSRNIKIEVVTDNV